MIVFKNDVDIFTKKKNFKYLKDTKEWEEAIKFFRNKKNKINLDISSDAATLLKKSRYIFGPIADGGIAPIKKWHPKAIKPLKYQLCLRKEDIAEKFFNEGRNVQEVIFFNEDIQTS